MPLPRTRRTNQHAGFSTPWLQQLRWSQRECPKLFLPFYVLFLSTFNPRPPGRAMCVMALSCSAALRARALQCSTASPTPCVPIPPRRVSTVRSLLAAAQHGSWRGALAGHPHTLPHHAMPSLGMDPWIIEGSSATGRPRPLEGTSSLAMAPWSYLWHSS